MSLEGVWKVEMLGPYGWENISTAFMVNGKYLSAGSEHHSVGGYEEDGEQVRIWAQTTQDGEVRTIFGETRKLLDIRIEARQEKPGEIAGSVYPADNPDFDVRVRLTRLENLN